ncbi:MAG: reverse transcriptase domain-containing protein [Sphingopyxis granuli]|uniref:reverse transcriptase domain-containing protein n=1 Tax=Sphingopyxis sp. SCN 67-31 TaxID=1660142 RepID=UPI00257D5C22|nr:reverse transcriptase domain-containing protein [Sphingopyxis sp. SCN 67-31]
MKLAATRWQNALQQIFSAAELNVAWNLERQRLKSSCYGIDRTSGKQFDAERSWRIPSIRERRLRPNFIPSPLLAIAKDKDTGGHRIICIPTIEDRLIQFNILHKIRDSLKNKGLLNDISYGLVAHSNRTVQDARNRATILRENGRFVYKTDIQKFFDRIPRDRLEAQIVRIVPYPTLHGILKAFASVEIGDGFAPDWKEIIDRAGIQTGLGVRQGMPLSPYFAGILLRDLDRLIEKRRLPVIRYVDDIIGFFKSRKECEDFDKFLREELGKMSLSLGMIDTENSKTRIYEPNEAAEFVGMEMRFQDNGKCYLQVSEQTLQRVEGRFAEMATIDKLLQKKITLPFLGARLEAMEKGYIAAYHGAQNMSELKTRVRNAAGPIVQAVLESIFGPTVKSLNQKERRFLGLE